MAEDPTIHWTLANPYGIKISEAKDAWHSGAVTDVLELDTGALVVASDTGGVWTVDPAAVNMALSNDWAVPDVACLAFGPDDPRHIFAGCARGIIRETDLNEAIPILAWREIDAPVPTKAGTVNRILVIRNLRRIVAACDGGLFWAVIPPTRVSPRAPYVWKEARVNPEQGFWEAAVGATRNDQARSNLEDRRVITIVAAGKYRGGIFVGQWDDSGELSMRHATLHNEDGTDVSDLFTTIIGTCSVSSCEQRPAVLYGTCAWRDGRIFRVVRSNDGGRNWRYCGVEVTNSNDDLTGAAGDYGSDWVNYVAAHPTDPGMAMIGWVERFLTLDGGKFWKQVYGDEHLHADHQALRFYPETAGPIHYLFIGSDGGVARVSLDNYLNPPAASPPGVPFQSNYNRQLPTMQCYSSLVRNFYGTLAASRQVPGLISVGLQDNSNIYCLIGPPATPWIPLGGGDGGWNAFIAEGALLQNVYGGKTEPVYATNFDATGKVVSNAMVPVVNPPEPPGDPGLRVQCGEAVIEPRYRQHGKSLQAVAALKSATAGKSEVFGLYVDEHDDPHYSWELIATVDAEQITAIGSYSGNTIHVGTSVGRIYAVQPANGSVLELEIKLPKPSPDAVLTRAAITRIAFFSETEVFAVLNGVTAEFEEFSIIVGGMVRKMQTSIYVIRLRGVWWEITPGVGLKNEPLYGLEAIALPNSEVPRALLVTTDDHVYISRDDGANWQPAGLGLPRTPHCADIRFVSIGNEAWIYLGTYGRSVWVCKLR